MSGLADKLLVLMGHLNAEDNDLANDLLEDLRSADDDLLFLQCLESAGVDNWSGHDFAVDLLREYQGERDE